MVSCEGATMKSLRRCELNTVSTLHPKEVESIKNSLSQLYAEKPPMGKSYRAVETFKPSFKPINLPGLQSRRGMLSVLI